MIWKDQILKKSWVCPLWKKSKKLLKNQSLKKKSNCLKKITSPILKETKKEFFQKSFKIFRKAKNKSGKESILILKKKKL